MRGALGSRPALGQMHEQIGVSVLQQKGSLLCRETRADRDDRRADGIQRQPVNVELGAVIEQQRNMMARSVASLSVAGNGALDGNARLFVCQIHEAAGAMCRDVEKW